MINIPGAFVQHFSPGERQLCQALLDTYELKPELGHIIEYQHKPYITAAGWTFIATQQGVKSIMSKIVERTENNVLAECVVTTADNTVYREYGYCERAELIARGKKFYFKDILFMALTRARNRTLRIAFGGGTSLEEITLD